MLPLGHLGIGSWLTKPLTRPWRAANRRLFLWVLLGTLLPDLIDKPLFHLTQALVRSGTLESAAWVTSSRTIGHTAILLIAFSFVAWGRKSRSAFAVALGMASHLLLDNFMDRWTGVQPSSAFMALVFPLIEGRFADAPFEDISGHLAQILDQPQLIGPEILGAFLLTIDLIRWNRRRKANPPAA